MGVALLWALNTGRIFIENPGTFLTGSPQCGENRTLDSCYFLPSSNCRPTAEQLAGAGDLSMVPEDQHGLDGPAVLTVSHGSLVAARAKAPERCVNGLGTSWCTRDPALERRLAVVHVMPGGVNSSAAQYFKLKALDLGS